MNRPRKSKGPYPPCFYFKHNAFYVVRQNKWIPLGKDYALALAEYGRIMGTARVGGMPKAIEDFYGNLPKDLAQATKDQYRYAADVLKRKLAAFEPQDLKSKHVAAIKQSLAETPNMANRVLSFLRQVCADLVERQVLDTNPCVGVKRLPEAKRKRLLSPEEWWAIHAQAGPRLQVIMELQFLTGQRIGDVLTIRRSQLTDAGIVFEQQKTGNKLTIRWNADLTSAVERAKAMGGDAPTLSLLRGNRGGTPDYRSVSLQFQIAAKAAGVNDARLNDSRARSATSVKKAGGNARALLGHTTEANTSRYLRDLEIPEVDGPSFRQGLDVGQKG